MDEAKIRATESNFAKALDRMTVEEIADMAVRQFYAMAEAARNLARENEELRSRAA